MRLALDAAAGRGVRRVTAMATVGNAASRRVLAVSGFREVADGTPVEVAVDGELHTTVHYECPL